MPKSPKKSPAPKPSLPKQKWLPLIVAGAVGFAGAFFLLKGCPLSQMSCPAYAKICPVTSSMDRLETCLNQGKLSSAKNCAEKLAELLEPNMPELAKAAENIAKANSLPEARKAWTSFQAKMKSGQPMPASSKP